MELASVVVDVGHLPELCNAVETTNMLREATGDWPRFIERRWGTSLH